MEVIIILIFLIIKKKNEKQSYYFKWVDIVIAILILLIKFSSSLDLNCLFALAIIFLNSFNDLGGIIVIPQ